MKTNSDEYAPQLQDDELCDCGHAQDTGTPATVAGRTVMGWRWSYSLDKQKRLCHACYSLQTLDCGHAIGEHSPFTGGYATTNEGKRICYACADKAQRLDLLDRSKPFVAYLSGDGRKVTTWTGGELMSVTRETDWSIFGSRHNRGSCVRATDCHGAKWYGRGSGRSMSIVLRACK